MKNLLCTALLVASTTSMASDSAVCLLYINNKLVFEDRVYHQDYDVTIKGAFPNTNKGLTVEYLWKTSSLSSQQQLNLLARIGHDEIRNLAVASNANVSLSTKINDIDYAISCSIE